MGDPSDTEPLASTLSSPPSSAPDRRVARAAAEAVMRRPAALAHVDPAVPWSLATRDFTRISESLLNAVGAAIMTALTVGAGMTATGLLAGLALGLLHEAPGLSSPRVLEILLLCVAGGGMVAIAATLFVGLLHFVLPRAARFVFLLVRAPWFVPSTLLCAPLAGLWRLGLWRNEPWERSVLESGLQPRWSFRARRYAGTVGGQAIDVRQELLGGPLELRCPVPEDLPAAYVGPQKIAGAVGVLRPLVACPALTDAELLLRDGLLVVRRRWVRPNVTHLAHLVARIDEEFASGGLAAELQTISLLAEWRQLRPALDERWRSPWFDAPAIVRYLETLKRALRVSPPSFDILRDVLVDPAVRNAAKSWLMSVTVHRLSAREAQTLAEVGTDASPDPVVALTHAPRWSAWVGVHRLALEGGPEALGALQNLVSSPSTPSPLLRAARRAILKIIQRNGGVHTLTGHLSVVGEDGGGLALVQGGGLSELADADERFSGTG